MLTKTLTTDDILYIKESVKLYNDSDIKQIIKELEKNMIISTEPTLFNSEIIDSNNNIETIMSCIDTKRDDTLKIIENFEIDKVYKYGAMFLANYTSSSINDIYSKLAQNSQIIATHTTPTIHKSKNLHIIKFIDICKGTKFIEETMSLREDTSRFPMLVILHPENIIEIKVPFIPVILRNNDKHFYYNKIKKIKNVLENLFKVDLKPINMYNLVNNIANEKENTDVKVSSQKMQLASGGDATLNSSNMTNETILPLLGELTKILEDNTVLFNKTSDTMKIKELVQDFIDDTNETSELPWISLRWTHQVKSKRITVKFLFEYYNNYDFTLMEFYSNPRKLEGMNHVATYLIKKYLDYNCNSSNTTV